MEQRIHESLEERVSQREAELREANERTRLEIEHRTRIEEELRKKEQQCRELMQSEARFRRLISEMSNGFALHEIICDGSGQPCDYRFLDVNQAFERMVGLSAEQVIGKTILELVGKLEDPRVEVYGRVALTGESVHIERYSPDLNKHFDIFAFSPEVGQFATVFTDITDRTQAEMALRKTKEELEHLLASSATVLYRCEPAGSFPATFISRNVERQLGFKPHQFTADPEFWARNIHPEDMERVFAGLADLSEKDSHTHEYRFRHRDGSYRWTYDQLRVVRDDTGKPVDVIGSWVDVTQQKRLQEEVERVQRLESIGVLAGGIAHDFNNILTAILGNLSLAIFLEASGESDPEVLRNAEKACFRARDLAQQLLTFSKGGAPLKKPSTVAALVHDAATFSLSGSNVSCTFDLPPDLLPVEVDAGQITQVIQNLVINSDQAMPEGGEIRISAENVSAKKAHQLPLETGNYVKMSIEDRGIGIKREHLPRVFDPFFTTKQKGSGLGLATSHSIVTRHGGHIAVDSNLGIGTRFDVYLPAARAHPAKVERPPQEVSPGRGRILVMDDEDMVRVAAVSMLTSLGYEAVTTRDGMEAIAAYGQAKESEKPFRAVILDVTVPGGMGGVEAAGQLLAMDPEATLIISTGYASDPILAEHEQHGFVGVARKPYTLNELSAVLRETTETE